MAISPVSNVPAYLPPITPVISADQPLIETVGFNQRSQFVGPSTGLQRLDETGPAYLRAFTDGVNGANTTQPVALYESSDSGLNSSLSDLIPSLNDSQSTTDQLDLFGADAAETANSGLFSQGGLSSFSSGLSEYASIQNTGLQPVASSSLSLIA